MKNGVRIGARVAGMVAGVVVGVVASIAGATEPVLLVTDAAEDTVKKYDLDGNYLGKVFESSSGGVDQPLGMAVDGRGNLYVSGDLSRKVHRFDLATGASRGVFAEHPNMVGPAGMEFYEGNLWVSDGRTGRVFRFDDRTGDLTDIFISGMAVPEAILFDEPRNRVVVGDWLRNEFRSYDLDTGAFITRNVVGSGLERPLHAELSADGTRVRAVNFFGDTFTEHSLETGELIRSIDLTLGGSPLSGPVDWVTLADGSHIVSSTNNGLLLRYSADWQYQGVFAQGNQTRAGALILVSDPIPGPSAGAVLALAGALAVRRRR